jgi:succinate dehydrogenase / fumarate reductase membrane anchor subunit
MIGLIIERIEFMRFVTPLKKAYGLGTVKHGWHHWLQQRLTALALIPLCIWLAFTLVKLSQQAYQSVVAWFQQPLNTVLLSLFIILGIYHACLGVQVIIEDYVHTPSRRIVTLMAVKGSLIALGTYSLISVGSIAF